MAEPTTSENLRANSRIASKLTATLPSMAHLPGSEEYKSSVNSYFYRTARQSPALIIRPETAEQVSTAVKELAALPDFQFAIRSGGHAPHANFSNVENGVTLDLSALNFIRDSKDRVDVVEVGPAAQWGDIYEHLEKTGRTCVGSRESSVGVAGFITGGGLSFFSPKLGFACDNIVNVEVVLASGDIVHANSKENSDLFRAIRGGQCNFGIVTRLDILTHEQATCWGGGILYPDTTENAQLQAWVDLKKGDHNPNVAVVQSFLYFGAQRAFMVSNNMVYLDHVEKPEGLKGFEEIQPHVPGTNTMRLDSTKNFALELQGWQPLNQYAAYATATIKISLAMGKKINNIWRHATETIADIENITSVLTYQTLPPTFKDNPNSMGLAPSLELHRTHLVLIMSMYWSEGKDTERVNSVTRDAMTEIEKHAEEAGALHEWKYMNYAGSWQDPLKSYGEDALREMKD
ncbi:Bifunctional solanapyrone synthase, partial [Lachnellula suecica]